MVNAVNTDWKLTSLDNLNYESTGGTTLWTADADEPPDNLNQQVQVAFQKIDRPRDDQDNWMSWGYDGRAIALQGIANYDKDVWRLSSAVNSKQLMKFWAGEDWFTYVVGRSCTVVRDTSIPTLASYTVSLLGVDPFWYWSNSAVGSGTGESLVVPYCAVCTDLSGGTGTVTMDCSNTTSNQPTTYVEPVFWFVGSGSDASQNITITDDHGRTLTCKTQAAIEDDTYVILPWRSKTLEGFMIQDSCVVKLASGDIAGSGIDLPSGSYLPGSGTAASAGDWGLDVFNMPVKYQFFDDPAPRTCINTQSSITLKTIKAYPRANVAASTSFDVTIDDTPADIACYGQWCMRRL